MSGWMGKREVISNPIRLSHVRDEERKNGEEMMMIRRKWKRGGK